MMSSPLEYKDDLPMSTLDLKIWQCSAYNTNEVKSENIKATETPSADAVERTRANSRSNTRIRPRSQYDKRTRAWAGKPRFRLHQMCNCSII